MHGGSEVIVEIRAAEGGDDAKLLVTEQFQVYAHAAARAEVTLLLVEERPGLCVFRASGGSCPTARELFRHEPGGHRWQRVPPNERRGRRHTSTVTVVVLPLSAEADIRLDSREVEWQATRGSGAGGQHRNVTDSAVRVKHVPSGITVWVEAERSQHANRALALRILAAKVQERAQAGLDQARSAERRRQVGSGMRGDKVRTVRMQDRRVVDHRSGKRTSLERYLAGHLEDVA